MTSALSPRRPGGHPQPQPIAGHASQLNNGSLSTSSSRRSAMTLSNNASVSSEAPPHIIDGPNGRILCIADVRGNVKSLNALASEHNAVAILHTGDFGFYIRESIERISDKTLRHLVQYSSLIPQQLRSKLLAADASRGPPNAPGASAASQMRSQIMANPTPLLSEFPMLLDGSLKLDVPVFTVWGACEDVGVLERFRTGEYRVHNLQVLDEATTRAIEVGGVRLRLFGLGGAVVMHKLFDNGEGAATIAGGQGTMWTTILQIGELIDTAQKTFDPTETRILITHASPGREPILTQVALAVKADLTLSAGLHFRYGISYNEFSVQHDMENFRNKFLHAKSAFNEIWETVKTQVDEVIDDNQRILLNHALAATNRVPPLATATGAASEEPAWKNTWNWNLPDAAFGSLVLDIKDGRIASETKSQGFNFASRKASTTQMAQPGTSATPAVSSAVSGPTNGKGLAAASAKPSPVSAATAAASPRNPPSGPASAASPSVFARGNPSKGPANSNVARPAGGQLHHQRSGTNGSAPAQSDGEQGKAKQLAYKHERLAKDAEKKGSEVAVGPNEAAGAATESSTTSLSAPTAATKSKRPRGGKNKGSKGGALGESGTGGETSGAEGLTSGGEGPAKKEGGKGTKKKDDKQQTESKPAGASEGEKAAAGGATASGESTLAGTRSGDESGKEGAASGRGARGGRSGGRGGAGRSGSGRGGKGPRSGGLNSDGGAATEGGNSSSAPAKASSGPSA